MTVLLNSRTFSNSYYIAKMYTAWYVPSACALYSLAHTKQCVIFTIGKRKAIRKYQHADKSLVE
jgi:hypothetical protein